MRKMATATEQLLAADISGFALAQKVSPAAHMQTQRANLPYPMLLVTGYPVSATAQATTLVPPKTSILVQPAISPTPAVQSPMVVPETSSIATPADWPTTTIVLPPGSERWTRFERDLFALSLRAYNPDEMARRRRLAPGAVRGQGSTGSTCEVVGRVSVVTPSMSSRQHFHEMLWASFEAQTWKDKELVVVETYEDEPSAFLAQKAKEDPRLVHVCFKRSADEDFSVGLKRDMTLHLASGEFIVNFDDDDIYAPSYISKMVREMKLRNLDALTLSSWYNYFVTTGAVGYADPQKVWEKPLNQMSMKEMDEVLYGYGFSYVHRRRVALAMPYPNAEFAEDAPFMLGLRRALGNDRVALKRDTEGLCMHLVHRANSAGHMPTAREVPDAEVSTLDVGALFQIYLNEKASTMIRHYRSVITRCNLAVESLRGLWPSSTVPATEGKKPQMGPKSSFHQPMLASAHSIASHRRVRSC